MRVLVIEDEAKIADYVKRGLSEAGYTVDVARDGIEGRYLALDGDYQLIVLDIMLPGIDGFGVLSALRQKRGTPVLMLTARDRVEDRVQGLQASGVIELFAAVINPEKLGQVNSTFLDIVVAPAAIERIAQELADCAEVVSLYIMSDLKSLHVHALTESPETFEAFVRRHIFNRPEILSVDCKTLLTRVKNRRGGARL